jgi:hypothetical protein
MGKEYLAIADAATYLIALLKGEYCEEGNFILGCGHSI